MSRLFISATRKSSGKTTVAMGLCRALYRRGLNVQPFKKGPDYIDPMWLSRSSGRPCINLDFNTMSHQELIDTMSLYCAESNIAIVEGNKGLFDGVSVDGADSNAALCRLTQTPVVLVLDSEGMTRGVAPLILGYQSFGPDLDFAGVILNKTGGSRHESKLRAVIERYTDLSVLGAIPKQRDSVLEERHLGLMTDRETAFSSSYVDGLADTIERHVDIEGLISAADAVPLPSLLEEKKERSQTTQYVTNQTVSIGVARDDAFCFYYHDDLQAMEEAGARLIFFDTLKDQGLPEVDGLFIGGGFPETHLDQLQDNKSMRNAIQQFVGKGMPVYAECGGLMYLAREIHWRGKRAPMVGAIPADVIMTDRPVGRGYMVLTPTGDHPWIRAGDDEKCPTKPIHAHEFHYSRLSNLGEGIKFGYKVTRGQGIDGQSDGMVYRNVFAGYAHMRHSDSNPWVHRFLRSVDEHKQQHNRTTQFQ